MTTPNDPPTSQMLRGYLVIAAVMALGVAAQITIDAYNGRSVMIRLLDRSPHAVARAGD